MKDIKIFVSCHKPSIVAKRSFLYPIQLGCSLTENRIEGCLYDNEGDNISEKNKSYCELTAQYYAWKNVEADYYGFFHYRRYFNLSENQHLKENDWGSIVCDKVNERVLEKLGLDDTNIQIMLNKYDVISTKKRDLYYFDKKNKKVSTTVYNEYIRQSHQYEKDLKKMIEIINIKYPEFSYITTDYMNGSSAYECNMFIMRADIFKEYSKWLFDILFETEKYIDMSNYSVEETRVMGFLAERACGIYMEYLKSKKEYKILEAQKTIFLETDREEDIRPISKEAIPIVLAANENFAPYMNVFIKSLVENNTNRELDIIVLHQDIKKETQSIIKDDNCITNRISIRFYDVKDYFKNLNLYIDQHLSLETYFRLAIQEILVDYDKVLYLDSDMVVLRDIKELYDMDIEEYALIGAKDIDYLGNCKISKEPVEYAINKLKLNSEFDYMQAGVLIFNLKKMREMYSVQDLLDIAGSYEWKHHDQDVLNYAFRGKIKFLPQVWNVVMDWKQNKLSRMNIISKAPANLYNEYVEARKNPYIVHYAGFQKPWNVETCDYAKEFWRYARLTSSYEFLIKQLKAQSKKVSHSKRHNTGMIVDDNYAYNPKINYIGDLSDNERELVAGGSHIRIDGIDKPIMVDGMYIKLINALNRAFPVHSFRRKVLKKVSRIFIR